MTNVAIELCNFALSRIGAHNIQSFNSPTAESRIAYNIYPGTRDSLLVSNLWSFATRHRNLVKRNEVTPGENSIFALPSDCMIVISCQRYINGPSIKFNIQNNSIICKSNICYLKYISRADERNFPEHFKDALRAKLVALFSLSLGNKNNQYNLLSIEADRAMQNSRRIETLQAGSPVFEDYSLIDS